MWANPVKRLLAWLGVHQPEPDDPDDGTPYCVNGCGQPATTQQAPTRQFGTVVGGALLNLTDHVELVCARCAQQ